jgi:hypothetical protein
MLIERGIVSANDDEQRRLWARAKAARSKKSEAGHATLGGRRHPAPRPVSGPSAMDRGSLGVPFASSRPSQGAPSRRANSSKNARSAWIQPRLARGRTPLFRGIAPPSRLRRRRAHPPFAIAALPGGSTGPLQCGVHARGRPRRDVLFAESPDGLLMATALTKRDLTTEPISEPQVWGRYVDPRARRHARRTPPGLRPRCTRTAHPSARRDNADR